jgi:hypothetical protein
MKPRARHAYIHSPLAALLFVLLFTVIGAYFILSSHAAASGCAVISSGTTLNYTALDGCGYPSPNTTGVPSGTALTTVGSINCTNTTINAVYTTGGVSIGNNCTITNSRIIGGGITVQSGVTGVTLNHDEISGAYTGASATSAPPTTPNCTYNATSGSGGASSDILWEGDPAGITLDYDYLHCAAEPFNGNGIVKDSYIVSDECWGPCGSGSTTHNEAIYIAGGNSSSKPGTDIEHNTILNAFSQTAGIFGDDHAFGPIHNLTINNNLIADGGDNGAIPVGNSGDGNTAINITNNRLAFVYDASMPVGSTSASAAQGGSWCGNYRDDSPTTYISNTGTTTGSTAVACAGSGAVTGDLNGDGHVNIFDLSIFLSHWQQTGSSLPEDFNNDGVVNIFDLSILLSHYGS